MRSCQRVTLTGNFLQCSMFCSYEMWHFCGAMVDVLSGPDWHVPFLLSPFCHPMDPPSTHFARAPRMLCKATTSDAWNNRLQQVYYDLTA
jgi:hypothetical protein